MNNAYRAFVAGLVSGLVSPLASMHAQPARRISISFIARTPSSVADSWRTVGKTLEDGMNSYGAPGKTKAA